MAMISLTCPECHATLRSASPIPPGRMVRCPQCSHHFTADSSEELVIAATPAASPALKTGLLAFGLVAVVALIAMAGVIVAVNSKNEPARPASPPEPDHNAVDHQIAVLQRRLDEQQDSYSRDRRRLEQTIQDLEARARVAEQKPAPPPPPQPTVPVPDPKVVAEDAAKKTRADYDAHMDAGRTAMVAQRYADALREYTAALTLMPGDADARRGQRDAENRLDGRQNARQQQAANGALVDKARAAYRAKHYDEAISAANQALRENPNDADAKQIQRDALQAKRTGKADASQLLSLADAALASGRYEDASRLYDRVLQILPDDDAAQRGKRAADQASGDTQASLAGYFRFMALGTLSMQNLQFGDASRAFAAALSQVPGDLAAARGLSDAQAALTGAVFGQAKYYSLVQAGYAALQAQRPGDAILAFQAANRLIPDSPLAIAGLRQARAMKK
jgi:predicted Zn finger-like uncharacterized protein